MRAFAAEESLEFFCDGVDGDIDFDEEMETSHGEKLGGEVHDIRVNGDHVGRREWGIIGGAFYAIWSGALHDDLADGKFIEAGNHFQDMGWSSVDVDGS